MIRKRYFEKLFAKYECSDFKWIKPDKIVVAHWVRFKCRFGCKDYGKGVVCPPNLPSLDECKNLFKEYEHAVVFHFEKKLKKPEQRHQWTKKINRRLFQIERDVFLSGYPKAFIMYADPCNICKNCESDAQKCRHQTRARPSPEGLGVDVFSTVASVGYPLNVLSDYSEMMNRYSILLIA